MRVCHLTEWFSIWKCSLAALAIYPEDEITMNRDSKPRQTQLFSRHKYLY